MAGSYPDVPGRRMAWDADGTVALARNLSSQGAWIEPDATVRAELNDENNTNVGSGEWAFRPTNSSNDLFHCVWIFPELREVDGFFYGGYGTGNQHVDDIESSDDTTNGIDGTWTNEDSVDIEDPASGDNVFPERYRTAIRSEAITAARAIRITWSAAQSISVTSGWEAGHIYGTITPGSTPDRLLWIDEATGLEFAGALDFGDTPRGGSEDYELRLKNNSATLAATTIQYTAEALYRDSDDWYTWTLPGGATFQATRSIASIAADTTTGVITLRRITPSDVDLGLHAARALVDTASFA